MFSLSKCRFPQSRQAAKKNAKLSRGLVVSVLGAETETTNPHEDTRKEVTQLIPEMFPRDQIVSNVIINRFIERCDTGGVACVANACDVGLGVILVAVAEILGHVDEVDALWLIESAEDGVGECVPCVHLPRADVEETAAVALNEVQRHLNSIFYVNEIPTEFAIGVIRI